MNNNYLEQELLTLCSSPKDFDYICKHMRGLDPIAINQNLVTLLKNKRLKKQDNLWVSTKTKGQNMKHGEILDHATHTNLSLTNFKIPHPLDYEWRNTESTIQYFMELIKELGAAKNKVLLLGMPYVFFQTTLENINRRVVLVDKNESLTATLGQGIVNCEDHQIINEDVFAAKPAKLGLFKSVLMDPPWYSEHFFQFIWLASQCIEVGGTLVISMPSINTRPGIDKERIEWFSYCQSQGLCLDSIQSGKLEYISPFFEFNAFRAAGLTNLSPFWRKGDIAVFKKIYDVKVSRPAVPLTDSKWIEKEVGGVRFRLKKDNKTIPREEIKITHLVKGDILPSVSSRDERRKAANLWTSGNRIFQVNDPESFIEHFDNYRKEIKSSTKDSNLVSTFLELIIELESKEYNNYLEWLEDAKMERQANKAYL